MPEQPLRPIAKRTTIYLPERFILDKPTFEINDKLNTLCTFFHHSNTLVSVPVTFEKFNPFLAKKESVTGYQIVIDKNHRETLARIRQQTGLTISQLAEYCFRNEKM
ncbi:hypothetical protein [Sporosarcina sp. FSL K6-5500]|uniref:hypothetical protein n=1 Tax=Sporosarcina sp. FSL K6-5500 TaxID=2921558 RepID=UPI0030FC3156